jgi:hypothetical protein
MPQDDSHAADNQRSRRSREERQRAEAVRAEATRVESTASAAKAAIGEIGDMGANNMQAGLHLQKEMFDTLQDIGREWMQRASSGAELAMRLPTSVTSARTPVEAFSAYREWLSEWMHMCGEDGFRAIADGRKIIDTGVRCFTGSPTGMST